MSRGVIGFFSEIIRNVLIKVITFILTVSIIFIILWVLIKRFLGVDILSIF